MPLKQERLAGNLEWHTMIYLEIVLGSAYLAPCSYGLDQLVSYLLGEQLSARLGGVQGRLIEGIGGHSAPMLFFTIVVFNGIPNSRTSRAARGEWS